jgi:hypothetical protein
MFFARSKYACVWVKKYISYTMPDEMGNHADIQVWFVLFSASYWCASYGSEFCVQRT